MINTRELRRFRDCAWSSGMSEMEEREKEEKRERKRIGETSTACRAMWYLFLASEDITSPKLLCFSEHGGAMPESRLKRAIA